MNAPVQRIAWAVTVWIPLLAIARASAAPVKDQTSGEMDFDNGGAQGVGFHVTWAAQSFKPGTGMGKLLTVKLRLDRDEDPPSSLEFCLRGNDNATNLFHKTIAAADIADTFFNGNWISIDITLPSGTTLNPGSTYWLVLYCDYSGPYAGTYNWLWAKDAYANGNAYVLDAGYDGDNLWPPSSKWTAVTEADFTFETWSDDGYTDVSTTSTVSLTSESVKYPTTTTVTVTVKDSADHNVPGGTARLSVSPAEGTFQGHGSGPVELDMTGGPQSINWTPPLFTGSDRTYTFRADYGPFRSEGPPKKNYVSPTNPGTRNCTAKPHHVPVIDSIIASRDDFAGDDVGVFVGGLHSQFPAVVVNNQFTISVSDDDDDLHTVEILINNVTKATFTDQSSPYEFIYDMSLLNPGQNTLTVKATDARNHTTTAPPCTIWATVPPPWLAAGYVLNPQVTWNFVDTYTFTGKIPRISDDQGLYLSQPINIPYLGTLQNIFESDIDVVETFTTSGDWNYSIKGVLDCTVLSQQLFGNEYPADITTKSVSPFYERDLSLVTWSRSFELFDETVNVYDGIIASFNVLGIQFDVKLSVDFGFNATVTISGSLGPALTPDNITVTPALTPYVVIDIALDILWGTATVGAVITPTFTYSMDLVYEFNHVPPPDENPFWRNPCLEFVLKAKFYVDLLWGAGHWESGEGSYGHTQWGCDGGSLMSPPLSGPGLRQEGTGSALRLFQAPSIAFDANGHGLAVWIHDNDPSPDREDPEVYYALYQNNAWGQPQPLTNNQRWETDPKVAFIGNNRAVVVWTHNTLAEGQPVTTVQQLLRAQDLWYAVWDGGAWTVPPTLLTADLASSDGRASLAGDQANGRAIVTWVRDGDGNPNTRGDRRIYACVGTWLSPAGPLAWGAQVRLNAGDALAASEPNVAFAPDGSATCAWVRDTDGNSNTNGDRVVVYSRWTAAGGWAAPALLPPPFGFNPPQGCLWPSVTHDAGSNPVIVFTCRKQDTAGNDSGEGFQDRLWFARLIGGQWTVRPTGGWVGFGDGRIRGRWPVAKLRPDNFVQVIYRTDTCAGPSGFDGDVGSMVVDVRHSDSYDSPEVVPSNDDVLDWQITMDVDNAANVNVLWVRRGSDHPGATFGDGYDDLMLMVMPTLPNLAIRAGDVQLADPYPAAGADAIVTAKIRNLNAIDVAVPFLVNAYLDVADPAHLVAGQPVLSLGPNADTTVTLTFPAPLGSHTVLVVADDAQLVTESSETDNTGSTTLWPVTPPTALAAFPDPVSGGIALTWWASTAPQIGGYRVYRSLTSGSGFESVGQTSNDALTFLDTPVNAATNYFYYVIALDPWLDQSPPSNEATANVGPDTDADGIPNIADPDDDADGMPDAWEALYSLDPLDPSDATGDPDDDGFANLPEYQDGTDPRDPNSHRDITAPSTPVVIDDGAYSTESWALHATWSADDPETGIAEYQYAVGTTGGGADVVDWTSAAVATEACISGLSLTDGQAYYVSIKARNGAGLWSSVGSSDGIIVDTSRPNAPVVQDGPSDDIDCQRTAITISANWWGADAQSGIALYRYAVGTMPHGQNVVPWTDAGTTTTITVGDLSLSEGTVYYVSVMAVNGAGLNSAIGSSDGVLVQTQRCSADFNDDCHVDQADWELFAACALGPTIPQTDPHCTDADLDHDNDIDQTDYGLFQRCYTGPNQPADPHCAE